jgi:excisionase family DNA binding protein
MIADTSPATDLPLLLTKAELADLLRCSGRTLYRQLQAGELPPPVRIGRLLRWRRPDIEQWIDAGCPAVK